MLPFIKSLLEYLIQTLLFPHMEYLLSRYKFMEYIIHFLGKKGLQKNHLTSRMHHDVNFDPDSLELLSQSEGLLPPGGHS